MSSKHHDPDICTCIDCWTTPDQPTPSPAPASGAETPCYVTRGLTFGSYRGDQDARRMVTHSWRITADDSEGVALCKKVSGESVCFNETPEEDAAPPTCATCLKRDPRFARPTPPSDAGPRERETCDDCNNLRAPLCLAHGCIIAAPAAEGPQDGPNWRTLAGALIHTAKDGPDGAVIVGGDEYVALCAAYAEPIQFSRHQPPAASAAEGPREEWTTCTLDGGVVYAFHHPCRRAFVVQQEHDCTPSERASA